MSPLKTLLYVTCVASIASSSLAMDAQDADNTTEPLKIEFSRAFGAPADGSWDGLFSGDNILDPIKYATERPEQTIFKSAQYALSSATSGNEIWYGSAAVYEDAGDPDESRDTQSRLPDDTSIRPETHRADLFSQCCN